MNDIGASLISARKSKGMTQKVLAKLLGMKEQQIQRYEKTNYQSASLKTIAKIAQAMNCRMVIYEAFSIELINPIPAQPQEK